MDVEQSYTDFKKKATAIKRYCEDKSPRTCDQGKCRFSTDKMECVFEDMGMERPYKWDLTKRRASNGK